MKAISLWQPWATAIVCGAKRIETRHWSTKVTGRVAIHAAKRWDNQCANAYGLLSERSDFCGLMPMEEGLPFGAIVGTVRIIGCAPVETMRDKLSELELALGNFGDGRWGWLLEDAVRYHEPIPYRGAQGFFNAAIEELF